MKLISKIAILLFVLNFCCSTISAQENKSYFLHTIEKGQSLYSISNMYGVSQTAIINLNPECKDKIYAGQKLRIPQNKTLQNQDLFHTIKSGETLYRLTVMYGVSGQMICDANPGLSARNFQIGTVIRIPNNQLSSAQEATPSPESPTSPTAVTPNCKDMHKVKRKETIYSISHKYGITEKQLIAANPELRDNDLKKGHYLCIPYNNQDPSTAIASNEPVPSNNDLFRASKLESRKRISTVKAAIILPFMLKDTLRREPSNRIVEYYEGFLMAIDSLKRTGVSVDLYTYDSGNNYSSIRSILAKDEMKKMDIIFGPLYPEQVPPLASFAKEHHIRLVIPFTSKDTEVFQNPAIYQINTPQSYLYSEVYEHFTRQFSNANVIFLESTTNEDNKVEFIKGLKQELKTKAIPFRNIHDITTATIETALYPGKKNIFIPTSGSSIALLKIIPQLKIVRQEKPEAEIHLFGYPEWQTYTQDHLEDFFELDTYFYSSFYTNNLLPAAIKFTKNYHKYYSKAMANTYPKYGMLGYDTAFFFLKGLSLFGSELEENLSVVKPIPIQTGFKFERVNTWGGFVNRKVFFVRFTKDFELIKLDFDQI